MDNRCDTDNSVGARAGEQLHDGRVDSRPAGDCYYRGAINIIQGRRPLG